MGEKCIYIKLRCCFLLPGPNRFLSVYFFGAIWPPIMGPQWAKLALCHAPFIKIKICVRAVSKINKWLLNGVYLGCWKKPMLVGTW